MNILFIYSMYDICSPQKPLGRLDQMAFGISYISAQLKKNGHTTRLLVTSSSLADIPRRLLDDTIGAFQPKLICCTAVYSEYRFISNLAQYIKTRYPHIFISIGGAHPSLNPEQVVAGPFDAVCIGEGEYPTLELAGQLEQGLIPSGIANFWFKRDGLVEKNPPRPFLENLDELPFPDRLMWQPWIEDIPTRAYTTVLLGRGCPFECTYCCNHALKKITSGPYVRLRSPDNIVSEIKEVIAENPRIKTFGLEMDTIAANQDWLLELCSRLEVLNQTLAEPRSFEVNLRVTPGADFSDIFAAFKRSHFTVVNIGVESGSERVRRDILRRSYSNEDIRRVREDARRYGLKIFFYNIIGIPGETRDDFQQTVEINRAYAPDGYYVYIFFPYPGTDLFTRCQEQGLLKDSGDTSGERTEAKFAIPGFTRRQIRHNLIWFSYFVARGRKNRSKLFIAACLTELLAELKTLSWFNRPYEWLRHQYSFRRFRRFLASRI
jgi:anaerobic magnesium-protoporphyrin IX monomethyl ester cyclase